MTDVSLRATPLRPGQFPPVIDIDDDLAREPSVVGAKAAALARARARGLSVLPGFAVTTAGAAALAAGTATRDHAVALHAAWQALSDAGRRPVVVRSSSTVEDGGSQSMAGMFTSLLDVRGWEAFLAAVDEVIESGGDAPIAVLVQPFIQPQWGGVLFGADPVTGRTDRLVVAAVPGGPDRLVSGQVDGIQLTLSARGRLRDGGDDVPAPLRARRTRRGLVRLARKAAATFGGPQDIEWAIDDHGHFVMLQSRPITAIGDEARAVGPVLGPGPVAETFGLPLRPLEEDLWVAPLRDGLREALAITGATSARRLRESPVVVTVGGRVAADLELLGLTGQRPSLWSQARSTATGPPAEGGVARRTAQGRAAGAGRRPDRRHRRRPAHPARGRHAHAAGARAAAPPLAPDADRVARPRGAGRPAARRGRRPRHRRLSRTSAARRAPPW